MVRCAQRSRRGAAPPPSSPATRFQQGATVAEDQAARRTSEWPLGAELDRAARYVGDVRRAPNHAAKLQAAASVEGLAALRAVFQGLPRLGLALSDTPIGGEMRRGS